MEYKISIYLDIRRTKNNGLFPVKLRVYSNVISKAKLYPLDINLSESDFNSIWYNQRVKPEFKEIKYKLQGLESKAVEVANSIQPFTFEQFEKKFFRKSNDGSNIFYYYQFFIEKLTKLNQLGTCTTYVHSQKSIKEFIKYKRGKEVQRLSFIEITPDFLQEYEFYMLNKLNRSRTTISIYLRVLKVLFNQAINDKEISNEIYPFGQRKYRLPASRNIKKSLNNDELKLLLYAKTKSLEQEKARDFWFFSFACNGMNIKDIAMLRYENLQNESLYFYRAKTINTNKTDLKPTVVYLTEKSLETIRKYGNPNSNPKQLIFSIIDDTLTEEQNYFKIKNFTRFINQHIKHLAKDLGLSQDISTYWARHSFASKAIREGASIEFVGEAFNHSNPKTTMNYFAGFEDNTKKEFTKKLMDI